MKETTNLITYSMLAAIISLALLVISYILTQKQENLAKIAPYECGYEASYKVTKTLDIKYYIIAIIFLIFDLEISYVYPYVMADTEMSTKEYTNLLYLLLVLTLGFVFEWRIGALKW